MQYLRKSDVLSVFGEVCLLDYKTRGYVNQIKELPAICITAIPSKGALGSLQLCPVCRFVLDEVIHYCPNCGVKL